ncbi:DUF4241 domain-containing protein [Streptomyces sp. NBC_01207]|uniref:DUF4241 domain-containing protein n=1 Tax=Streptomyces sp. NBC_01207 TaxID=2903772 RepID=UPI002E0EF3DD|nr:DUF4241 domain-containing protein [Streptomyces sp. NBC_01207]
MPETTYVTFEESWDAASRTGGRALSPAEARARDAAGLPYAVIYRVPGREVPLGARMVAWQAGILDSWAYDEHGRRTAEAELRLRTDEGRLLIRCLLVRRYPDAQTAEFDVHCPRTAVELSEGGSARISHQPEGMRGASLEAEVAVAEEHLWTARPCFDDWPALPVEDTLPDWVAAELDGAASDWRREPSRLLGSADFDRVFRPGTLTAGATVLDSVPCGSVRVPSGVLAVACPQSWDEVPGITVAVPPGTYPLKAALVEVADRGYGPYKEVTAVRLQICDAPVAAWEMALGPGDDTLQLRAGEAFGFDTDGATGAFGDAGVWQDLRDLLERAHRPGSPEAEKLASSAAGMHLDGGGLGADLAVFYTGGDGVYPVWVGRSASGEVVCVDVQTAFERDFEA